MPVSIEADDGTAESPKRQATERPEHGIAQSLEHEAAGGRRRLPILGLRHRQSAEEEGASFTRMPSGAGHDAMVLAHHVPAAMLFVPSRGGLSHCPEEFTSPEQCELGARVLARTVRDLLA